MIVKDYKEEEEEEEETIIGLINIFVRTVYVYYISIGKHILTGKRKINKIQRCILSIDNI